MFEVVYLLLATAVLSLLGCGLPFQKSFTLHARVCPICRSIRYSSRKVSIAKAVRPMKHVPDREAVVGCFARALLYRCDIVVVVMSKILSLKICREGCSIPRMYWWCLISIGCCVYSIAAAWARSSNRTCASTTQRNNFALLSVDFTVCTTGRKVLRNGS